MRILAPILLLVCAVDGCYRYVPVQHASLAKGSYVAIELTSRGSANAVPLIGDHVASVEGTVSETDSSGGITLALLAVKRRGENLASTWAGESIRFSEEDIAEIRGRQLSRRKTVVAWTALGAASAAIIVAVAKAAEHVSGSPGGRPINAP